MNLDLPQPTKQPMKNAKVWLGGLIARYRTLSFTERRAMSGQRFFVLETTLSLKSPPGSVDLLESSGCLTRGRLLLRRLAEAGENSDKGPGLGWFCVEGQLQRKNVDLTQEETTCFNTTYPRVTIKQLDDTSSWTMVVLRNHYRSDSA